MYVTMWMYITDNVDGYYYPVLFSAVAAWLDAIGTFLALLIISWFARGFKAYCQKIDEATTEVADFTLYVTRLPPDTTAFEVRWSYPSSGAVEERFAIQAEIF